MVAKLKKVAKPVAKTTAKRTVKSAVKVESAIPSTTPREMTIRQLEESNIGSVFAINNAPRSMRGDILFSVPKMQGNGQDAVRVVKTWIPQDLTEQVTKRQLLESSEFRKTVSKGLIVLLSADYADRVLSQPDAREEQQRIANLRNASLAILKSSDLTDDDDNVKTPTQRRRAENQARAREENEDRAPNMAASEGPFDVLLSSLEDKSETEILNALRSEGQLTKKELRKVIATFPDHRRVVAYAEKKMQG